MILVILPQTQVNSIDEQGHQSWKNVDTSESTNTFRCIMITSLGSGQAFKISICVQTTCKKAAIVVCDDSLCGNIMFL